jgi:hypothetical protein
MLICAGMGSTNDGKFFFGETEMLWTARFYEGIAWKGFIELRGKVRSSGSPAEARRFPSRIHNCKSAKMDTFHHSTTG